MDSERAETSLEQNKFSTLRLLTNQYGSKHVVRYLIEGTTEKLKWGPTQNVNLELASKHCL